MFCFGIPRNLSVPFLEMSALEHCRSWKILVMKRHVIRMVFYKERHEWLSVLKASDNMAVMEDTVRLGE